MIWVCGEGLVVRGFGLLMWDLLSSKGGTTVEIKSSSEPPSVLRLRALGIDLEDAGKFRV